MTARIDVAGPINRLRDQAIAKLDAIALELSTPEERAAAELRTHAQAQAGNPGFAIGVLAGEFNKALAAFAAAFDAGYRATGATR